MIFNNRRDELIAVCDRAIEILTNALATLVNHPEIKKNINEKYLDKPDSLTTEKAVVNSKEVT